MVAIHTKYMTRNDCYTANKQIKVTKLLLHATAARGVMAEDWFVRWNKSYINREINRQACVHAFVDDKEVWQYLPWNHRGWHAGGSANNFAIGVEMCEDLNHTKQYCDDTVKNTAELFAKLCVDFNLNPLKDIFSHSEGYKMGVASNHADPEHWITKHGYTMDKFKKMVYDIINKPVETKPEPVAKPTQLPETSGVMHRVIVDGKQIVSLTKFEDAKAHLIANTPQGKSGIVQRNTDRVTMFSYSNIVVKKPLATWEKHINGSEVSSLQNAVNRYFGDKRLAVDGFYGDATFNGVPNGIRFGLNRSDIVGEIQKRLSKLGFYKMRIDKSFGNGTLKAVIAFQKSRGFSKNDQDGIVGKFTFSELYKK